MAGLTWTSQALYDVDAICEFIARDVPRYAQLFATQVFKSVERLEAFPESGRVVPEVGQKNIRLISFVHDSHPRLIGRSWQEIFVGYGRFFLAYP
jgi:plasmid stabilization system protein ParE